MYATTIKRIEESGIFELYKSGRSIKSLHKEYGINERSIANYLKSKGISIRKDEDLLKYDVAVAQKLYEEGKTLNEISEILGCTRQSLSYRLKKRGVKILRKDIMSNLKSDVFDEITTEEQAYWLGFLFADGNISAKDFYIRVNLAGKDLQHLNKLKNFLNYERDVLTYKTPQGYYMSRLSVSNKHLWNRLNEVGCVPNKSNVLKFPNELFVGKEDLVRHFIRGYWDGDGCLTYRNKEHTRAGINVISTMDFLREMEKHLPVNKPKKTIRKKHKSNDVIGMWEKEDRAAYRVAEYLYKDSSIYLERKYEKYLEYCRLYEKL